MGLTRLLKCALLNALLSMPAAAQEKQAVLDENGVYHVPAFALPPSPLASEEYRQKLIERGKAASTGSAAAHVPRIIDLSTVEGILKIRAQSDAARKAIAEGMLNRFPVKVTPLAIAGVQTDVVEPQGGISERNRHRVLINLHGGGFVFGARWEGQVASIPISGIGGMKVITVDYRMGPEHKFPAASEDVAKVYQELLKSYRPENIGIYGCSAGAILTAQSVAWFGDRKLPQPGAIALDSAGAMAEGNGSDSGRLVDAMSTVRLIGPANAGSRGVWLSYHFPPDGARSWLQSPAYHVEKLKAFPPSLLISATRDQMLGSVLYTHRQLINAGVESDLHVWEGIDHCFTYDDSLPESREAYRIMTSFFDKHLGIEPK